jgi:hypothetical protein
MPATELTGAHAPGRLRPRGRTTNAQRARVGCGGPYRWRNRAVQLRDWAGGEGENDRELSSSMMLFVAGEKDLEAEIGSGKGGPAPGHLLYMVRLSDERSGNGGISRRVRFNGRFKAPVMGGEARTTPGGEATGWRCLGAGGKPVARDGDGWQRGGRQHGEGGVCGRR